MPEKGRYAIKADSVVVEGNGMRCQKCGLENPEHIAYCGKCGGLVRESAPFSQSQEEGIASIPNSNDSVLRTQSQIQRNSTKSTCLRAAAIAALIGGILLISALALNIYYNELAIDDFGDHEIPYDRENWDLRVNIGKAMGYSQMTGYICVFLAILLLVQGWVAIHRRGASFNKNPLILLVRIRYLALIALICVTAAFCLYLFLVEVQPSLGAELMIRLSSLLSILQRVAWVSLAMMLFIVARQMR